MKERHSELSRVEALHSLYGMGSFFRNAATHRDVDLVAVLDCETDQLLSVSDIVREVCRDLDWGSVQPIEVTIFTLSEFGAGPLQDMETLVPLYVRDGRID